MADVQPAIRVLARRPAFTLVAVLTLAAAGIGVPARRASRVDLLVALRAG